MTDRELLEKIANRMDNFDIKLDELKDEIGGVRQELKAEIGEVRQELKAEIGGVRQELKAEISGVRQELKAEIGEVRQTLIETTQELREEIGEVKLVLENEIRNNIAIIAEGHLDLNRKLNEAIKEGKSVVNIEARTSALETKVRQIAEQIKVS